jgi:tRNA(Ile)-lysidine synthase
MDRERRPSLSPFRRWSDYVSILTLDETVQEFVATHEIDRVVVAVSGGPDSTALLVALHELGADVVAAHVNHHLRGEESDGDERFVRELCARLGIALHVFDGTLAESRNLEAAARAVRERHLKSLGIRWIATAHQLNDQAETVLMRLMTGSGLAGLRGIHAVRDDGFVRPMLEVTRAEVEAFLRARGIVARSDSSNADPRFLRNRVRALLCVMPESVSRNLAAVAKQAAAQWRIVEQLLNEYEVEERDDATIFKCWPADEWLKQALLLRHIRRLDPHSREVSAKDLERLAKTARRTSVTKALELEGNVLRRRRQARAPVLHEIDITPGEARQLDGYVIHLDHSTTRPLFQLPSGAAGRFTLRTRRPGDRFRHKKLKDFFIDRKIARDVRDAIPLLLWNDQIVWVGGVAISDAFQVTDPAGGELYDVWMERAGASVEAEGQAQIHGEADRQTRRYPR